MNTTTFVGLDVHARSIKAVALDAMTGEVRSATFAYDAAAVAAWGGSLDPAAKCVYESGVTGFDLQKKLTALGKGVKGFYFSGACGGCNIFTLTPYIWASGGDVLSVDGTK